MDVMLIWQPWSVERKMCVLSKWCATRLSEHPLWSFAGLAIWDPRMNGNIVSSSILMSVMSRACAPRDISRQRLSIALIRPREFILVGYDAEITRELPEPAQSSAKYCSSDILACLRIPLRVPVFNSGCIGTTQPIFPVGVSLASRTWLPDLPLT